LRGQESNLRTRGSKPRISTSRNYPAVKEGRVGLEPTRWCLTNTCSAAELPTQSRMPCGNRTRLSSLEGWHLSRSVKGTYFIKAEAVGLEPTTGISPAPVFETGSSSSRMTSIHVQAAVAGIEPAFVSLTGSRLTVGPHRNSSQSTWSDLNRRSRAPEARGFPDFPTRCQSFIADRDPSARRTFHANKKAPSGSRTRTSALARRYAAATS